MHKKQVIHVIGESMWPYLKNDDLVYVSPDSPHHIGSLVLLEAENMEPVIHRLISNDLTKGDNNPWDDQRSLNQTRITGTVLGRFQDQTLNENRFIQKTDIFIHRWIAQLSLRQLNSVIGQRFIIKWTLRALGAMARYLETRHGRML